MTLPQFFASMYEIVLDNLKKQGMAYLTIFLVAAHLYVEQGKYRIRIEELLSEVRECEVKNAELRAQVEALQSLHMEADTPKTAIKPKRKR